MARLSISDFAAACGMSVPALRRYGDAGVIVPAQVDERSGYRYYDREQIRFGVIVRTLRELNVPVSRILEMTQQSSPEGQLKILEEHWADVERSLATGRAARDHLERMLGGWEDLIRTFAVEVRELRDLPVLLRRRHGSLLSLPQHLDTAVAALEMRAEGEELPVVGVPVSLYYDVPDASGDDVERVIEVCLPIGCDADADAILPGGLLIFTDAQGPDAAYPQVLAAYGAVSEWAHEHGHLLLQPPMMIHLAPEITRVGWRVHRK